MIGTGLTRDARRVLAAQALRAFAYGFGAVLIGVTLSARGFSSAAIGLVLGAVVAGTALVVEITRYDLAGGSVNLPALATLLRADVPEEDQQ